MQVPSVDAEGNVVYNYMFSVEDLMENLYKYQPIHLVKVALDIVFGRDFEWDDSAEDTARRIVGYWKEYDLGLEVDDFPFRVTKFEATFNQMVTVRDIEFSSLCMHHLLPFYGLAHVAYIPNEYQIGLSKIPRIVKHIASRPQVQETMTGQIASILKNILKAHGVMVVVEARHTCMSCRGIRAHSAAMVTSDLRGVFLTNPAAREEFLALIARRRL